MTNHSLSKYDSFMDEFPATVPGKTFIESPLSKKLNLKLIIILCFLLLIPIVWLGFFLPKPRSCTDVLFKNNGRHTIYPDGITAVKTKCFFDNDLAWSLIDFSLDKKWLNFLPGARLNEQEEGYVYPDSCLSWQKWFTVASKDTRFAISQDCRTITQVDKVYRATGNYYECLWYAGNDPGNAYYNGPYNFYQIKPPNHGYASDTGQCYSCKADWWNTAPSIGYNGRHCVFFSQPKTGKKDWWVLKQNSPTIATVNKFETEIEALKKQVNLLQNQMKEQKPTNQKLIPTTSVLAPQNTTGWTFFHNKKFLYTLYYPPDWQLGDRLTTATAEESSHLALYGNSASPYLGFTLDVDSVACNNGQTLESCLQKYVDLISADGWEVSQKENNVFSGVEAALFKVDRKQHGWSHLFMLLRKYNRTYLFAFTTNYDKYDQAKLEYYKILNTFQFDDHF